MQLTIGNCYEDGHARLWVCAEKKYDYFVCHRLDDLDHSNRAFAADGVYFDPEKPNHTLVREYLLCMDGNAWCATNPDFDNLQESPAGFGDSKLAAIKDLLEYERLSNV